MSRGQSDRGKGRPPSLSDRVDEACDRLEAAYLAGGRPRIEDHLPEAPGPQREAFFRELLAIDLAYRRRRGEVPRARDYIGRFPGHDALIIAAIDGGGEAPVTQSGDQPPHAVPYAAADKGAEARGRTRLTLTVSEGPHQGRIFTFEDHEYFIVGRGKTAHFRLSMKDGYFSRNHFMIEFSPPHCRLLDLASTNGTFVNGKKVGQADLGDGDVIRGGKTAICVTIEELEEAVPQEPTVSYVSVPDRGVRVDLPRCAEAPSRLPELLAAPRPSSSSGALPGTEPAARACLACNAPGACFGDSDRVVRDAMLRALLCPACWQRFRDHPQPFDGFGLLKELGHGGMGVVYLAVRLGDGVLVALKALLKDRAATSRDVARFLREARILRDLDHPHITRFLDLGESHGRLYLVMEFVPGVSAGRLLKQHGAPLPQQRAVALACQSLEALQYAHDLSFVHRDIKPSNILVVEAQGQDRVKLADFGLARLYESSRLSGLTISGDLAGTPPFIPPEQITHYRDARPPADIYAIGATLYYLLCGSYVYDFPSSVELRILKILQEAPVPIASRMPDLPPRLAAIIDRSLERNPSDRFPDALAMREALEPFR
jgi:serine/threonine-protein kinase